jgi:hypothetical protein
LPAYESLEADAGEPTLPLLQLGQASLREPTPVQPSSMAPGGPGGAGALSAARCPPGGLLGPEGVRAGYDGGRRPPRMFYPR